MRVYDRTLCRLDRGLGHMAVVKIHRPRPLGDTGPTPAADPVIWAAHCARLPSVRRRRSTITMVTGVERILRWIPPRPITKGKPYELLTPIVSHTCPPSNNWTKSCDLERAHKKKIISIVVKYNYFHFSHLISITHLST